ncbi:serine hydrolase [Nonomuraea longicatena]|uniref:Serine hydrolase n=1 Tax=Nonomuraea longicatena TaxID=83682 RepID=A0ABP3Z5G2_9ACTN
MHNRRTKILSLSAALLASGGILIPGAAVADSAPTSAAGKAVTPGADIPATPAGAKLKWLLDAMSRAPIPEAEVKEHISAGYLEYLSAAQFNEVFKAFAGLKLTAVHDQAPDRLGAAATLAGKKWWLVLDLDPDGKIEILGFSEVKPPPPAPRDWKDLERRLGKVTTDAGFLAAEIDGRTCRPVRGVEHRKVRPLGSMFKLYILGTVAKQIRAGDYSWDTELTITPELKSFPSGILQMRPDNSKVTVREAAELMISISDNTGTDLLLHKAGRKNVERTARSWGAPVKGNTPMLSIREMFLLKSEHAYPKLADQYKKLSVKGKRAFLADTIAKIPRSSFKVWTAPRELSTIEWFASPADICRAHAELRAMADPAVEKAMARNSGGVPGAWYKGGSEPGLLDFGYSVKGADGKVRFVTTMAVDKKKPFDVVKDQDELIALSSGAFKLMS